MPVNPRVLKCCEGIICAECASRYFQGDLKPCPKCRHAIDNLDDGLIRSRIVESLLQNAVEETCRNEGCGIKFPCGEKIQHRESCDFELVVCEHDGCEERMKRRDMRVHVEEISTLHFRGQQRALAVSKLKMHGMEKTIQEMKKAESLQKKKHIEEMEMQKEEMKKSKEEISKLPRHIR